MEEKSEQKLQKALDIIVNLRDQIQGSWLLLSHVKTALFKTWLNSDELKTELSNHLFALKNHLKLDRNFKAKFNNSISLDPLTVHDSTALLDVVTDLYIENKNLSIRLYPVFEKLAGFSSQWNNHLRLIIEPLVDNLIKVKTLIILLGEQSRGEALSAKGNLCHYWLSTKPDYFQVIAECNDYIGHCVQSDESLGESLAEMHHILKIPILNDDEKPIRQALYKHLLSHLDLVVLFSQNDLITKLIDPANEWMEYLALTDTQQNIADYNTIKMHYKSLETKPPSLFQCKTEEDENQLCSLYKKISIDKKLIEIVPIYEDKMRIIITPINLYKVQKNTVFLIKDNSLSWQLFFINAFGEPLEIGLDELPELAELLKEIPPDKTPEQLSWKEKKQIIEAINTCLKGQIETQKHVTSINFYADGKLLVRYSKSDPKLGRSFEFLPDDSDLFHHTHLTKLTKKCLAHYQNLCKEKQQQMETMSIQLPSLQLTTGLHFFSEKTRRGETSDPENHLEKKL